MVSSSPPNKYLGLEGMSTVSRVIIFTPISSLFGKYKDFRYIKIVGVKVGVVNIFFFRNLTRGMTNACT